jgi:hypothetical protein
MPGEMMFAVIAQVLVFVRRHKVEALIVALLVSLSTSAREGTHLSEKSLYNSSGSSTSSRRMYEE